jgi:hypothetical protein
MTAKQQNMIDNTPVFNGQTTSYVQGTADLFRWSENYDYPTPANLYLDLIGWSDENMGQTLYDLAKPLGYLEISMLADALKEYASNPVDVLAWVNTFMDDGSLNDQDEDES